MWEDVLSIVDDETGNDQGRLFVQDDSWDGSQYIRCHSLCKSVSEVFNACFVIPFIALYHLDFAANCQYHRTKGFLHAPHFALTTMHSHGCKDSLVYVSSGF